MRPIWRIALAGILLPATAAGQYSPLFTPVLPDGLGANIHFTEPKPGEMKLLAASGMTWVRMDFFWEWVEPEAGKYDFSGYSRLLKALKKHRIQALFILDYGHRLYDGGMSPHTPEGREAFARMAAAAVKKFRGRGIMWEMWNEPNIQQFWKPKVNVEDYIKLAKATGEAIKYTAPDELYIGPATSTMDFKFLEACFKGGLLEYWDAVSVHPYRQEDPETVIPEYERLRKLIDQYAPKGKNIPILSGEWGYSSAWDSTDEERQGRMLPRQWLTNIACGVPVSIWYDWRDDGPDPEEAEHHFGMVRHEYLEGQKEVHAKKPAYRAAAALTQALDGFSFRGRHLAELPGVHVLAFYRKDETRLAAWTQGPKSRRVTIPSAEGKFKVIGHTGELQGLIEAGEKGIEIELTAGPVYILPAGD